MGCELVTECLATGDQRREMEATGAFKLRVLNHFGVMSPSMRPKSS